MSKALKIVVADDELDMRDYFQQILPLLGHEVVGVARTGRELVDLCAAIHPDLVVTDIKMPDMDGIDAAAQIYRQAPIPVILVSAYHDPDPTAPDKIYSHRGGFIPPVAFDPLAYGLPPAYEQFRRNQATEYGPGTAPVRLLQGEPHVEILDLIDSEAYHRGDPNRRALVDLGGARSLLAVPLLKDNDLRVRLIALRWVGEERVAVCKPAVLEVLGEPGMTRELFESGLAALRMLDGDTAASSSFFGMMLQGFARLKNFGGIFSYLTSRWALATAVLHTPC